jgi:hypothetical protein
MIPSLAIMIWAYCTARLIEIMTRAGERKPAAIAIVIMGLMLVVMAFSCVGVYTSGVSTP